MSAGKGKRGPEVLQGTLSSSSDEDSPRAVPMSHVISPQMTTEPLSSVTINNFGDHDYEHYDVSSPSGSSTVSAGNSVCERRPGFTEYAREVPRRPKQKKKKPDAGSSFAERSLLSETTSVSAVAMPHGTVNYKMLKHPVVPRPKPHRDPVPMRMRALPQSMWQEPNVPHDVSPATQYPVLPPLVTREGDDIAALRPVTPPEEREEREREKAARDKSQKISGNGFTAGSETSRRYGRLSERTVSVANPDLLMRLFDAVEACKANPTPTAYFSGGSQFKKGRAKKILIASTHKSSTLLLGQDPYLVENITEKLFPQLSLERGSISRQGGAYGSGTTMVHLQPLAIGDKTIMLPSLSIDQNYSQMLSEVVAHI